MEGATGTLYEGEKFQLLFKFSSRYPFDSPQVSRSSPTATSVWFWVNMRCFSIVENCYDSAFSILA